MKSRFDLIPIKKRILAFATDGEIEAKLRSILARRWGGNNFPKLTEIVYRLYMQWGKNGNGGNFKQGVLSARTVKIIDDAIAEACRSLGIASWEAKNVVRKLDKEINMAFKRGVTDARLDLKKMGISMALDRRNEMLFDLNRAKRHFDEDVRFANNTKFELEAVKKQLFQKRQSLLADMQKVVNTAYEIEKLGGKGQSIAEKGTDENYDLKENRDRELGRYYYAEDRNCSSWESFSASLAHWVESSIKELKELK